MRRRTRQVFWLIVGCAIAGTLALPHDALSLPDRRAYEMVSPPYKGGYGATRIEGVAPDGKSVAFGSVGAFAGVEVSLPLGDEYIAHRTEAAWVTEGLEPPPSLGLPQGDESQQVLDYSPTLSLVLWHGCKAPNVQAAGVCGEAIFMDHLTASLNFYENWELLGEPLVLQEASGEPVVVDYDGASADFCHLVLQAGPLVPEAIGTRLQLYDMQTGCNSQRSLRPIGLDNQGAPVNPHCSETIGHRTTNNFNAVSRDAQEIFFTQNVAIAEGEKGCGAATAANPEQLFVRVGDTRTVEVSRPLSPGTSGGCGEGGKAGEVPGEVPCSGAASRPSAVFWGSSEDGTKVYFTTAARLVPADGDSSRDLYEATIGCPEERLDCEPAERQVIALARISEGATSTEAYVRGVVKIAPDGSHVAFIAGGVLTGEPGVGGRLPQTGADNLYVYDALTRRLKFVADLCSGPALSGLAKDASCPTELEEAPGSPDEPISAPYTDVPLWLADTETREAQFNVCGKEAAECTGVDETGRFLVFTTYGRLTKNDIDDAKDIYRYDMLEGSLERVSVGEEGFDANGNCEELAKESACDANIVLTGGFFNGLALYAEHNLTNRAVSEDGSRVVFETTEPLASRVSNGLQNVYEWHREPGEAEGTVAAISTGSALAPDRQPVLTPSGEDLFFMTTQSLVPTDTGNEKDVYDARHDGGFPQGAEQPQHCEGEACLGPLSEQPGPIVPGSLLQAPTSESASHPPRAKHITRRRKHRTRHRRRSSKRRAEASKGRSRR